MGRLIAYIGGARSGKSRLAQERAKAHSAVTYIATGTAAGPDGVVDAEMVFRIARHRADRPANWTTIEEGFQVGSALQRAAENRAQCVLLDCMTLWLSNRMLKLWPSSWHTAAEERLLQEIENDLAAAKQYPFELIVVSNDLGGGVVPSTPLGRAFRDVHGRANQRLGAIADEVQWVMAGLSMKMK